MTVRIMPCLDIREGRVVKGIHFIDLIDAGDPVVCAQAYEADGADELGFLDITATVEKRRTVFNVLGPLLNPVRAERRQLLGVADPRLLEVIPAILPRLGVERAALVTAEGPLAPKALPAQLRELTQTLWAGRERRPTLRDVEQAYIRYVLEATAGNQTRAAAVLGISRKALWEKRRRYGIG